MVYGRGKQKQKCFDSKTWNKSSILNFKQNCFFFSSTWICKLSLVKKRMHEYFIESWLKSMHRKLDFQSDAWTTFTTSTFISWWTQQKTRAHTRLYTTTTHTACLRCLLCNTNTYTHAHTASIPKLEQLPHKAQLNECCVRRCGSIYRQLMPFPSTGM